MSENDDLTFSSSGSLTSRVAKLEVAVAGLKARAEEIDEALNEFHDLQWETVHRIQRALDELVFQDAQEDCEAAGIHSGSQLRAAVSDPDADTNKSSAAKTIYSQASQNLVTTLATVCMLKAATERWRMPLARTTVVTIEQFREYAANILELTDSALLAELEDVEEVVRRGPRKGSKVYIFSR
ncbi:hypothetical protein B0H16DRAFT_1806524 [Mycena metata]|uniref:Uncharacterized protein n=1 Tax=Mycena metata TaxID=1033252 RepID=A0AAD7MGA1_9AGAR|nr:hypothetical protein B0H16DRAFT_1806524 [Mycena metata]